MPQTPPNWDTSGITINLSLIDDFEPRLYNYRNVSNSGGTQRLNLDYSQTPRHLRHLIKQNLSLALRDDRFYGPERCSSDENKKRETFKSIYSPKRSQSP